jgi:hypothetical protein
MILFDFPPPCVPRGFEKHVTMTSDHAVLHLDEQLGRISERFESGEMCAFGRGQEKLRQHFDELRRAQEALAERQVAASMEKMKGHQHQRQEQDDKEQEEEEDGDDIHAALDMKEAKLTELAAGLSTICRAIEETNTAIRRTDK